MLTSLRHAAEGFLRLQADYTPQDYGGAPPEGAGWIAALFSGVFGLIGLLLALVVIAGFWKVYAKAGQPGWAAIVPIYNVIVLTKLVGKPMWVAILLIIPCTAFIGWIIAALALAKCFGKETGFAIGLILLPVIFVPMLGFGDAQYRGPVA
jgi:hypothetical protein